MATTEQIHPQLPPTPVNTPAAAKPTVYGTTYLRTASGQTVEIPYYSKFVAEQQQKSELAKGGTYYGAASSGGGIFQVSPALAGEDFGKITVQQPAQAQVIPDIVQQAAGFPSNLPTQSVLSQARLAGAPMIVSIVPESFGYKGYPEAATTKSVPSQALQAGASPFVSAPTPQRATQLWQGVPYAAPPVDTKALQSMQFMAAPTSTRAPVDTGWTTVFPQFTLAPQPYAPVPYAQSPLDTRVFQSAPLTKTPAVSPLAPFAPSDIFGARYKTYNKYGVDYLAVEPVDIRGQPVVRGTGTAGITPIGIGTTITLPTGAEKESSITKAIDESWTRYIGNIPEGYVASTTRDEFNVKARADLEKQYQENLNMAILGTTQSTIPAFQEQQRVIDVNRAIRATPEFQAQEYFGYTTAKGGSAQQIITRPKDIGEALTSAFYQSSLYNPAQKFTSPASVLAGTGIGSPLLLLRSPSEVKASQQLAIKDYGTRETMLKYYPPKSTGYPVDDFLLSGGKLFGTVLGAYTPTKSEYGISEAARMPAVTIPTAFALGYGAGALFETIPLVVTAGTRILGGGQLLGTVASGATKGVLGLYGAYLGYEGLTKTATAASQAKARGATPAEVSGIYAGTLDPMFAGIAGGALGAYEVKSYFGQYPDITGNRGSLLIKPEGKAAQTYTAGKDKITLGAGRYELDFTAPQTRGELFTRAAPKTVSYLADIPKGQSAIFDTGKIGKSGLPIYQIDLFGKLTKDISKGKSIQKTFSLSEEFELTGLSKEKIVAAPKGSIQEGFLISDKRLDTIRFGFSSLQEGQTMQDVFARGGTAGYRGVSTGVLQRPAGKITTPAGQTRPFDLIASDIVIASEGGGVTRGSLAGLRLTEFIQPKPPKVVPQPVGEGLGGGVYKGAGAGVSDIQIGESLLGTDAAGRGKVPTPFDQANIDFNKMFVQKYIKPSESAGAGGQTTPTITTSKEGISPDNMFVPKYIDGLRVPFEEANKAFNQRFVDTFIRPAKEGISPDNMFVPKSSAGAGGQLSILERPSIAPPKLDTKLTTKPSSSTVVSTGVSKGISKALTSYPVSEYDKLYTATGTAVTGIEAGLGLGLKNTGIDLGTRYGVGTKLDTSTGLLSLTARPSYRVASPQLQAVDIFGYKQVTKPDFPVVPSPAPPITITDVGTQQIQDITPISTTFQLTDLTPSKFTDYNPIPPPPPPPPKPKFDGGSLWMPPTFEGSLGFGMPSRKKMRAPARASYRPSLAGLFAPSVRGKQPRGQIAGGVTGIRPMFISTPAASPIVIAPMRRGRNKPLPALRRPSKLPTVMRSKSTIDFLGKTFNYMGGSARPKMPNFNASFVAPLGSGSRGLRSTKSKGRKNTGRDIGRLLF